MYRRRTTAKTKAKRTTRNGDADCLGPAIGYGRLTGLLRVSRGGLASRRHVATMTSKSIRFQRSYAESEPARRGELTIVIELTVMVGSAVGEAGEVRFPGQIDITDGAITLF